ncbi:precorrin-3B C(17)-methyltransferase [Methyloligella solikamskensis]|uniref:Precorrin-3B C(17)-methyltransferase n=1 Tax=Methyloligella solikamskensis TaxID=1177756 RepID=A0ABW3J855_9HYPH
MTGKLTIVGLGPGSPELTTPAVANAVRQASDLVGYETYLKRLPDLRPEQEVHASDNRYELDRARHALSLAASGRDVAVVSGGDPGVFAMAAAVFEVVDAGDPSWRDLTIEVQPGVSAMLAAAAEAGAPLGGDFCAISLSDNLKSWGTIEWRLVLAAQADFAIALYNPASKARPDQLGKAFALLRQHKPDKTVVIFVRAAGTPEAKLTVKTLGEADGTEADMRTLVIVGAETTRLIRREGRTPWVYTPRSEGAPR